MIAYLEGRLLEFTDRTCVVVTGGGVGYEVAVPTSVLAALPPVGGEVRLFAHTVVREDALELYGFLTHDEREVFRTLISIDKLGPKKALAILSHFDAAQLRDIAFREDAAMLATVPGIGPKSSKQILWFLKDKIEALGKMVVAAKGAAPAAGAQRGEYGEFLDALAGLRSLGYSEDEIRPMLRDIFDEEDDLDAAGAIRIALKKIAAARS